MRVHADTLRLHLDYSSWASRRVVEAAASLTPEQLKQDFSTADRNVLGTLVHVYAADRIWLGRIQGPPPPRFLDPETDLQFPVLQNDWPALHERWRQWAANMTDDSFRVAVPYKDL